MRVFGPCLMLTHLLPVFSAVVSQQMYQRESFERPVTERSNVLGMCVVISAYICATYRVMLKQILGSIHTESISNALIDIV